VSDRLRPEGAVQCQIPEGRYGRGRQLGVYRLGGQTKDERWMGDQSEVCQISDDPMLHDRVLADLKKAGPFAAGTGLDGFVLHGQRLVCRNRRHEMAVDPLKGGRSEVGLWWSGSKIRVPVRLLQFATGTVWMA
jgi:hypothetical protein